MVGMWIKRLLEIVTPEQKNWDHSAAEAKIIDEKIFGAGCASNFLTYAESAASTTPSGPRLC